MPIDFSKAPPPPPVESTWDTAKKGIHTATDWANKPLIDTLFPSVGKGMEQFAQPSVSEGDEVVHDSHGTASAKEPMKIPSWVPIAGGVPFSAAGLHGGLRGALEGFTRPTTLANVAGLGGMVGASVKAAELAPEAFTAGKALGLFGKVPGAVTSAASHVVPQFPNVVGHAAGAVNMAAGLGQASDANATPGQAALGLGNAVLGAGEMVMPTGIAPIPKAAEAAPIKPLFNTTEEFLGKAEHGLDPSEWEFIKAKQAEEAVAKKAASAAGNTAYATPWNDAVVKYANDAENRAQWHDAQFAVTKDSTHDLAANTIRRQVLDAGPGIAKPATMTRVVMATKQGQKEADKSLAEANKIHTQNQVAADDVLKTGEKQQAQGWNQEAKNLNAGEKAQANIDATNKIEQQKLDQQLTAQPPQISETTAVRNGPVTERMSTRFTPPPPEEDGDVGGGGAATSGGPTPSGTLADPLQRSVFPSRDKALRAEKAAGAFDSVKNPEGPGWIHVFPSEKPKPPAPPVAPPVPEAAPVAPPVDDLADIKAVATPPQEDFSDIEAVAQPPIVQPKFTSDKALNPVSDRDIQALDDKLGGPDVATPGNGLSPAEPPAPSVLPKLKSTKTPKGKKPVVEPVPAVENQVPNEAPIEDLHPNLTKSAPSEDINDVDLATGVTTTKPIKVPTGPKDKPISYNTAEEAGAAAQAAGLPEHSIDQFKGSGFRIAPTKPYFKVDLGADTGPDVGFHKPEGVVMENTQGKWNRTEFKSKGEDTPQAAPASPETPKAAAPAVEPAATTEAVTPTKTVEPPTQATAPKGGLRVGPKLKKKGVEELPQEELDKLSPDAREAYFKKTDPMLSANFPFRHNIKFNDPQVAADWKKLAQDAPRMNRKDVYNQLKSLYARNRGANAAQDKADDFPEIGSPRWQEFYDKFADPQSAAPKDIAAAENEGMPPAHDQSGFTTIPYLGRALAAGVGAGISAKADPVGHATGGHHPYLSALLAGGGMLAAPALTRELSASGDLAPNFLQNVGRNLNALQVSGMLSPISGGKKILADLGGIGAAAYENPERAGGLIANMMSPSSLRQAYQAGKAGMARTPTEEETGFEQLFQNKYNPLSWVGRGMGGATAATKDIMSRSNFNPLEQGLYTMTNKPITKLGARAYDVINSNNATKFMAPLARIGINRLERGNERFITGLGALGKKGLTPEQKTQIIKNATRGTLLASGISAATPPGFVKKHPVAAGLITAAANVYGVPASIGMAASTLRGDDSATEALKTVSRDLPGAEIEKYLGSGSWQDFLSTKLANFTNVAKPLADYLEPEDQVIKTSPRYNTWQNATYGAQSNIPGRRGQLPHRTVSVKPLTQQELEMLQEFLDQGGK